MKQEAGKSCLLLLASYLLHMLLDDEYTDKQEVDLEDYEFTGKLTGKSWKHELCLSRLEQTKKIMLFSILVIFYPVLTNLLFHSVFLTDLMVERVVFALLVLIGVYIMPKRRLLGLILALIPLFLLFIFPIIDLTQFSVRRVGFNGALLMVMIVGIHFHFKEKKIREELVREILNGNPEVLRKP